MRQAHLQAAQIDQFRPGRATAIQEDERLSAPVREDLDVPPADATDACPERLHDRFLGCEPGREL